MHCEGRSGVPPIKGVESTSELYLRMPQLMFEVFCPLGAISDFSSFGDDKWCPGRDQGAQAVDVLAFTGDASR